MKSLLIAKFGTEEHLNQLKDGKIFFNKIKAYRDDESTYRGDSMEGRIPIDPKTIKIFNEKGENLFDSIPLPDSVIESIVDDDDLMMFCASAVTKEIMYEDSAGIWKFNKDYVSAVEKFGTHVLLLWTSELLSHIRSVTDETGQKIGYDSGMILYRALNDFNNTDEYRKTGSKLDRYFVKSKRYCKQNEWRVIVDGEQRSLKANCGTGFILQTSPFENSMLMGTTDFLNGVIKFSE